MVIVMSERKKLFNLSMLLDENGFDIEKREKTMIVVHRLSSIVNKKITIEKIIKAGFFEPFQCEQNKEIFKDCEQILSFIGESGKAKFIGCYSVGEVCSGEEKLEKMPKDYPDEKSFHSGVYYDLRLTKELEELNGRLIIEWDYPRRKWYQKANIDLPVIDFVSKISFPGYEKASLTFQELEEIIKNDNGEWKRPLSKMSGVYLITTSDGLYVGSAYGKDGFWARWSDYINTKHGGNVGLKELISNNNEAYNNFRFTILKVLPINTTQNEVLEWENYFKNILFTKESKWGLNEN